MRRRSSGTRAAPLVAIIVDTAVSFDRDILAGAAQYAREVGDWRLYVEEEPGDRLPDLRQFRGGGVIASFDDRRVARAVTASGLPTVAVGGGGGFHDPDSAIPYVGTDEERIVALAVSHLLERGLRSFGYYGTVPAPATVWSEVRGRHFVDRLEAAGLPCSRFTARHSSRHWDLAQTELRDWLKRLPKPVGVMACDDIRGRHVIESCRSVGLRVPHDVAVIGVDDDELVCELTDPPLSSIAQATRRIGYEAARLLDRMLRPRRPGRPVPVPRRLVIPPLGVEARGSTDTLVVGDPVITQVLRQIQEFGYRNLTVAGVVQGCGVSRWTLERRFKRAVGRSIHDHIARLRLLEAQRLIRTTNLPLAAVAARSGFNSVPYMTTVFRQSLGTTPARFRLLEQTPAVRQTSEGPRPG